MPTYDELYAFVKAHYKADRFEGRNDRDYPDYSHGIVRSYMGDLERRGWSLVSRHESVTGQMFIFDAALRELPGIPFEPLPRLAPEAARRA